MSEGGQEMSRRETTLAFVRRFSRLWGFLLFLLLMLVAFRSVVMPFILGGAVAYLLAPIIKRLGPKMGRGPAILVTYLVLAGFMSLVVGALLPALIQDVLKLRDSAPELIERVNQELLPQAGEWLDESFGGLFDDGHEAVQESVPPEVLVQPQPDGSYRVNLENLHLEVQEGGDGTYVIAPPGEERHGLGQALKKLVGTKLGSITTWMAQVVQAFVPGLFSFFTSFVVTFMVAGFLLVDIEAVVAFVRALVPPEYREDYDELVVDIDIGMSGVIRGQLMICVVNGILTYVGLLIFSVKYSLLLGLLAGALSLVPIFGTIISSIPIVLIALVSGDGGEIALSKSLFMLLWIAGIHLLEANLLNPKILGESAQMHPVIVIFALLAGESMFGLIGALLAVPVASMVQTVFLYIRKQRDAGWGTVGDDGPEVEGAQTLADEP